MVEDHEQHLLSSINGTLSLIKIKNEMHFLEERLQSHIYPFYTGVTQLSTFTDQYIAVVSDVCVA